MSDYTRDRLADSRRDERIFLVIILFISLGWSMFCGIVGYLFGVGG